MDTLNPAPPLESTTDAAPAAPAPAAPAAPSAPSAPAAPLHSPPAPTVSAPAALEPRRQLEQLAGQVAKRSSRKLLWEYLRLRSRALA